MNIVIVTAVLAGAVVLAERAITLFFRALMRWDDANDV